MNNNDIIENNITEISDNRNIKDYNINQETLSLNHKFNYEKKFTENINFFMNEIISKNRKNNNKKNIEEDDDIIKKNFICSLSGWYTKDNYLINKMIKFDKKAICYCCFREYSYGFFNHVKTISFKKIESYVCKNNLNIKKEKINNIICICNNCFNNIDIQNLPKAPKNINHILSRLNNLEENEKNSNKNNNENDKNDENDENENNYIILNNKKFKFMGFDLESINNIMKNKIKKLKKENTFLIKNTNYLINENHKMDKTIKVEFEKNKKLNETFENNSSMLKDYKRKMKNELYKMYCDIDSNLNQVYTSFNDFNKNKISDESELACKICRNNKVDIVLNKCGHVMCNLCFKKLKKNYERDLERYNDYLESDNNNITYHMDYKPELKCPECRCNIKDYTHIYL